MKLQHKAWALVLVIVGLAASGAMLGARHIVADSFEQLETQRAEREGERARRLLHQQLGQLAATAQDYAAWVDAVAFVRGRKPQFMTENFEVGNMGYLRLSQVLMLDAQGRPLASVRVQGGALVPVPAADVERLRPLAAAVLAGARGETTVNTVMAVDGSLDLVSVAAIRDPAHAHQVPAGALIMVRHLDEAEIQRLSDTLMVPVSLSFDLRDHAPEDSHQMPVDDEHDALHAVVRDHLGRPVAELVLTLDRQLYRAGEALSLSGMGLAALAGLLAAFLLVPLLDRLVLRRLQRLHTDLQAVTDQGLRPASSVQVQGQDEISTLARGINQLLDRVRSDASAQRESHERQEALQMQLMQSQKTEALGRLTGGIAHDFNNSLAAITGWVRLAVEDLEADHPSGDALQQALKATRYADGLMRQLLAFGRQAPPKLRRLHWTSLIEETRQMVGSGLARECELVVDYRVDDDEVDADPTQLQQVLVNLLINAADAMQGKGRIELALTAVELPLPVQEALPPGSADLAPGRYLVLTVCDHGPGIAPELRDRVFEPFFTTKPKGRGTGLGLSVAQGILLRHHGGIGLSHHSQGGACFHLYLPASPRDAVVAPITAPDGGLGQGRHLLFVDDDQLVRHAWSALLERKGWNVTRARDGEEAWTQFSQSGKHWDLVLTDQSMPRLDGVGLAQRIQASTAPPPVVLMSGHVDEVPAETLRLLFAAVLRKPVDAADLDRVLKDVLASGESLIAPL
jgi:signal transduction histidine kinase/ActR/RegA family two-component response regulator